MALVERYLVCTVDENGGLDNSYVYTNPDEAPSPGDYVDGAVLAIFELVELKRVFEPPSKFVRQKNV